jgi:hypothetical protein
MQLALALSLQVRGAPLRAVATAGLLHVLTHETAPHLVEDIWFPTT